jgi:predicted DNA binding CopG/RHH family protein
VKTIRSGQTSQSINAKVKEERDLEAIQARAVEDGIPYQTLMASVLHRFVAGRLKEA